jgi:hypothetical protein
MLAQYPNSEHKQTHSCALARTWVISPRPLWEIAHFNKEDALQQNATAPERIPTSFISQNLQSTLKKFTTPLATASGLHLYQRRLS